MRNYSRPFSHSTNTADDIIPVSNVPRSGWITTGRRTECLNLIFLLGLCYLLFFYNIGVRDIWNPGEDEYVLVNIEMVKDGHWFYPTANGKPYGIKPLLFNWIGSLISVAYGEVNEITSRLPSRIAALIGIFLVYFLGKYLFGNRAGLLSAMVLATSPMYVNLAHWIQINMISTLMLTATLYLFYVGYSDPRYRRWAYLLMYVPMGLGTLNMGPVNLVMPAVVICIYLFAAKDFKHILKLRIGWGILIYLLIVAPWYVAVSLKEGYADDLLITTNITRFFGDFAHVKTFYYYFQTIPYYFMPWLLYLPAAFYLCFSEKSQEDKKRLLFPFVWVASLFVFFSLSRGKCSRYLLPIFPALALLVGFMLDRALMNWKESLFWRRALLWPTYTMLFMFSLLAAAVAVYFGAKGPDWFKVALPIAVISIVGVIVGGILLHKKRVFEMLISVFIFIAVGIAYASGPFVAKLNETQSAKSFCLKIKDRIPEGEKLKLYRHDQSMYAVYTQRFTENILAPDELLEQFQQNKKVFVVIKDEDYKKIKDNFKIPIHVLVREWATGECMLLVSNRPERNGWKLKVDKN